MKLTDPHTPINLHQVGNQVVVDFSGAELPQNLMRRYDATDFGTPVTGFDVTRQGDGARIVVDAQGDYEQLAYQSDDQYVVEVAPRRKAASCPGRQAAVHRRAPDAELPGHRDARGAAAAR